MTLLIPRTPHLAAAKRLAKVAAVALALSLGIHPSMAQPTPPRPRPTTAPELAVWSAEYTASPVLPVDEGAISIAMHGDAAYVATETEVSRHTKGVWHSLGAPSDVSRIFAIAPADDALWATGLEGAAWRRDGTSGRWRRMSTGTAADLYGAVSDGGDLWAVGFDYDAEEGIIAHLSTAAPPAVYRLPALAKRQLYAVAVDPSGERWVGGCDYVERPFMLRDRRRGEWEAVALSLTEGCIYHLAFAPSGAGLAAAGGDLLSWDGYAWLGAGAAPPAGASWMRVAAQTGGEVAGASSVEPAAGASHLEPAADSQPASAAAPPFLRGWALAGQPTWRGFIGGQLPWTYTGSSWQPGTVADQGVLRRGEETTYVGLAGDGVRAVALGRPAVEGQTLAPAELLGLANGEVALLHPLLERIAQGDRNTSADVATEGDGRDHGAEASVWVGARGVEPFVTRRTADGAGGGEWEAAGADLSEVTGTVRMQLLDFAGPNDGWAVGSLGPGQGPRAVVWRWDGRTWQAVPLPSAQLNGSAQLRAVPGGRAWAVGPGRRLAAYEPADRTWRVRADWPAVVAPANAGGGGITTTRTVASLMAPFDAVLDGEGRTIGWLAAADGYYRVEGLPGQPETVTRTQDATRGIVSDLQLMQAADGSITGWAMAVDPSSTPRPGDYSAVLLHLTRNGLWEEVNRLPNLRVELELPVADAEWRLMSAASPDEVWLFGELKPAALRQNTVLMRYHLVRGWSLVATCSVAALAAQPVENGTDLWLVGAGGAGCQPRVGPVGPNFVARPPDPMPLAAIVSRIAMRRVAGRVFLPRVGR